jgi:hypothetical protein
MQLLAVGRERHHRPIAARAVRRVHIGCAPGWSDAIAAAAATPIQRRGVALVQTMIAAWDAPPSEEFLRSTILTAAHEPIARQRLATNFAVHILDAVSSRLDDDERLIRASLAATQIVGLAMMRYVWKVGAIATMPSDRAIALVAPTVQRYLKRAVRRTRPMTSSQGTERSSSPTCGSAVVPAGAGRFVLLDPCPHQHLQELDRQLALVRELDEARPGVKAGGLNRSFLGGEERRREP